MIDWEGKVYDFILIRKKYSTKWKQKWTDYKKWGDFGGKWKAKAEVYYTEEDLLKEITEPCYKFLEWKMESGWVGGGSGGGSGEGSGGGSDSVGGILTCNWEFVEYVNLSSVVPRPYINSSHLTVNPTGTKLYWYGDKYLVECIFSSPYDLSSINSFRVLNLQSLISAIYTPPSPIIPPMPYHFSQDGKLFYVSHFDNFFQFRLLTPWDITTMEYTGKCFMGINQYICPKALYETNWFRLSSDGSKLYIKNSHVNKFFQCSLSTPWDISTIMTSSIEEIPALFSVGIPFQFSPDGKKIYSIWTSTSEGIGYLTHNLTTPWDATTATVGSICYVSNDPNIKSKIYMGYTHGWICFEKSYLFLLDINKNAMKFAVKS